jgi:hypothetical protein
LLFLINVQYGFDKNENPPILMNYKCVSRLQFVSRNIGNMNDVHWIVVNGNNDANDEDNVDGNVVIM